MLYVITLVVFTFWMVLLIHRKTLSWHSIVTAYIIGVVIIDTLEVTFNLLLGLYKFPTHLSSNPIDDNQIGLLLSDTLILPFGVIIYIHYALKYKRWRTVSLFTILFAIMECIYVISGFLKYNNWSLVYSVIFYTAGFFFASTFLARPIASYNPPIPRPVRLFSFSYVAHMWIGAIFALPVLKLYQFIPGLFKNPMADDRFVDLYSGLVFGIVSALLIPRTPRRLKPLVLIFLTFIGISLGFFTYSKGWLIYHHWNHFFMGMRYFVPSLLIMLYNNWEVSYEAHLRNNLAAYRNLQ